MSSETVQTYTRLTAADMKSAGFEYDPTHSGHERWTHFPKEITCLRQPYMTDAQWERHKQESIDQAADGAPYCSYGHKTRASCDCEPIAENE